MVTMVCEQRLAVAFVESGKLGGPLAPQRVWRLDKRLFAATWIQRRLRR